MFVDKCCELKIIEDIMNGSQNRYFINNVSLKIPRKSNSSKYGPIIHIIKTTVATIEICGKWSFVKVDLNFH